MTDHVELIARQLVLGSDPDGFITGTTDPVWTVYKPEAKRILAALADAGRVIVPSEPTQGMRNAAVDATDMGAGMSWRNRSPQKVAAAAYRAMIAAGGVK